MTTDATTEVDPAPLALRALGDELRRAIRDGDSVFTPGTSVWTAAHAEELARIFADRPDAGGRSFNDKLDDQLAGASDGALQLFAELWCASLAPLADYTTATKLHLVRSVLTRMSAPVELPAVVAAALDSEAFSGGVAFKTRRAFQLMLLVRIAVVVTKLDDEQRALVLDEPRRWKALVDAITELSEPAQRKALAWLLFPDYFISVVSTKHRRAIRDAFAELLTGDEVDEEEELHRIRTELGRRGAGTSFYTEPILNSWDPERRTSGIPISPEHMAARTVYKSPGYALATAAIALIPEGRWSTYTDIAEVAGLVAGQVGQYVTEVEHPAGHRVIKIDGTTYSPEQQTALEVEGITFSERGAADPTRRLDKEDLREQLDARGLLPALTRRAWLVRSHRSSGVDLTTTWREEGWISLAATHLREVPAGISRDELGPILEDDYAHASYAARADKLTEFHLFLTRMHDGDLVVTVADGRVFVGELRGDASYRPSDSGDSNLVRQVTWHPGPGIDLARVPGDLAGRLSPQLDVVDLTRQLATVESLLNDELPSTSAETVVLRPATAELAASLHAPQSWLQECIDLLNDRPQLIFYGPPGTGKTYLARAIARHVAGDNRRLVQFHPAYSYEDFFEGYRPTAEGGFELKPGPMRKIVDQALENPTEPHVLIIDEINRGNLAKVFGELYFLLEYREENVELLYADGTFHLPKNVFIIGTMNTADRSIALVDAAMRRRFAFLPLHPSETPTREVLRSWLEHEGLSPRTADLLDELNRRIEDADFKIGPSYFMRRAIHDHPEALDRTWRTSILPLLEEHHFGEMTGAEVRGRYGLEAIAAAIDGRDGDAAPHPS